ncbi:CinA family protein [Angustibacter peucedani]
MAEAAVPEAPDDVARLAGEVVRLLVAQSRTLATAESLTGGLLAGALTGVPGASAVFRGGVVAYATDLKHSLVGVDDGLLARVGAVDREVAAQLAAGARERLGADLGLSTTGVAGPDPQDGHGPGTVWVGLADAAGAVGLDASGPAAGRAAVRRATVLRALQVLHERLIGEEAAPPGR